MTTSRGTFQSIDVHVFRDITPSFLDNLEEIEIEYQVVTPRPGVVVASATTIQVIQAIGPSLAALAAILVALIKNRRSRKLIITTRDNKVIHAEGSSVEEVERLLGVARDVAVFEPTNTARKVEKKRCDKGE